MDTVFIRALMQPGQAESGPIRFVASTEGVARDGLVIEAAGWRLENFQKNPVFLWVHDYRSLPIGRVTRAAVEGSNLSIEVEFDQQDEFARKVESKYRRGFLNAVSVGWQILNLTPGGRNEAPRVVEAELLEVSGVPVPSDPDALMERQARGLAALERQLADILAEPGEEDGDEHDGDSHRWEMAAIGMMRLYHPTTRMPEVERRRVYNRLAAQYRRLAKTAPEYLSAEEVDGLGLEELRGLFLEDEPELVPGWFAEERSGAVLSARNKSDLQEAVRLIQSVLERSTPADEDSGSGNNRGADDPADDQEALVSMLERISNQLRNFQS
jgi:HK97 family phage prohead protease